VSDPPGDPTINLPGTPIGECLHFSPERYERPLSYQLHGDFLLLNLVDHLNGSLDHTKCAFVMRLNSTAG
jgi:hypothetical protein